MCPSYMVTREEKHSTRGRARLLFEMLQRRRHHRRLALRGGARRARPVPGLQGLHRRLPGQRRHGHLQGRVPRPPLRAAAPARRALLDGVAAARWPGAAARAPGRQRARPRAGSATRSPSGSAASIPHREIPRFAPPHASRQQLARPPRPRRGEQPVVLWPDTFTNHFDPEIGARRRRRARARRLRGVAPRRAAVLRAHVDLHRQLTTARACCVARSTRSRPRCATALPLVGLEPSCTAVFRHDLGELFPHDQDACRLARPDLHARRAPRARRRPTGSHRGCRRRRHRPGRTATTRRSCTWTPTSELLERMGIDAELLDSGCCGLAGNFGFERGHHEVSVACAERVLLPAVRAASTGRRSVMADGFSCRTQIADSSATGARCTWPRCWPWRSTRASRAWPRRSIPSRPSSTDDR